MGVEFISAGAKLFGACASHLINRHRRQADHLAIRQLCMKFSINKQSKRSLALQCSNPLVLMVLWRHNFSRALGLAGLELLAEINRFRGWHEFKGLDLSRYFRISSLNGRGQLQ